MFTIYLCPSIGSVPILATLVSLLRLAKSVIPARIPILVALGSLVGKPILPMLVCVANLVSQSLHVVIDTRAILESLICLGAMVRGGPALQLTSNKPTPTSRAARRS